MIGRQENIHHISHLQQHTDTVRGVYEATVKYGVRHHKVCPLPAEKCSHVVWVALPIDVKTEVIHSLHRSCEEPWVREEQQVTHTHTHYWWKALHIWCGKMTWTFTCVGVVRIANVGNNVFVDQGCSSIEGSCVSVTCCFQWDWKRHFSFWWQKR